MEYELLSHIEPNGLSEMVEQKLLEGYKLYGNPVVVLIPASASGPRSSFSAPRLSPVNLRGQRVMHYQAVVFGDVK